MKLRLPLSLRAKFIIYLVSVHLLFAGVAVYLLAWQRGWLLLIEAAFVISLAVGVRLVRHLFGTLEVINTGAQFLQDSDFTSRFCATGQPEMDRLIAVYNHMADHLRAERTRLQEQHYLLEKIVTASPSGILTLDFDGRIAQVNPMAERMLAQPVKQLLGQTLEQLPSAFAQALAKLEPGTARVVPLLNRRRVKCWRSQFLDRGFTRDFILLEELTEELRQAEKTAYEKVIRMMSHEVNNSIGAANSLLHSCLHYAAQIKREDRADFETALRVIIGRTEQLNTFMRNFADVFRLPPPRLQPCDTGQLLAEVATLFKAECERRRIALRLEIGEGSELIPMDRGQMEQVFVNILQNAVEAIGADGVISLRLHRELEQSWVVIEDTGGGIAPAARAHLFTPFFSTKEHGQGIGLTLVQEILEQHGFEFSLDSQPGQPTRFTIYTEPRSDGKELMRTDGRRG